MTDGQTNWQTIASLTSRNKCALDVGWMHAMEAGHKIDWKKNTFTSLWSRSRMSDRGRHRLKWKLNANNWSWLSLINTQWVGKLSHKRHILIITSFFALKISGLILQYLRYLIKVTPHLLVFLLAWITKVAGWKLRTKQSRSPNENIHFIMVPFQRGLWGFRFYV